MSYCAKGFFQAKFKVQPPKLNNFYPDLPITQEANLIFVKHPLRLTKKNTKYNKREIKDYVSMKKDVHNKMKRSKSINKLQKRKSIGKKSSKNTKSKAIQLLDLLYSHDKKNEILSTIKPDPELSSGLKRPNSTYSNSPKKVQNYLQSLELRKDLINSELCDTSGSVQSTILNPAGTSSSQEREKVVFHTKIRIQKKPKQSRNLIFSNPYIRDAMSLPS
ncbi:unnamed protein product [Moneuplotes crassus]|uniref:Uncharacterized protein n=1 Tax=Euplotes crassus TaxID=5936 RepID=A0AAD1Y317_EUPCR|nr:unnamed protein product [Moneuplotes crassus]